MTERRSVHQTQWAAQFAVASELCKRGYQVALTLGNHPTIDLMVISPKGRQFVVDVKGQYRRTFWPVKRKSANHILFYVLAFVPDNAPNRFFIMTRAQVAQAIESNLESWLAKRELRGLVTREGDEAKWMTGIEWRFAEPHENAWQALPE